MNSASKGKIKAAMKHNDAVNSRNKAFALKNRYGFTDINHTYVKPDSVFRIAVLGDSFVWGDGLPYEQVWSHKLAEMLGKQYKNIEVMHWGINGWSTKDEFSFYLKEGRKYQPDLLIIGYVNNDADLGNIPQRQYIWRVRLHFLERIFPNIMNGVWNIVYDDSYAEWNQKLHRPENLKAYGKFLDTVNATLNADKLSHFMVMTSTCGDEYGYKEYVQALPYIKQAGFEVLEVIDAYRAKFKGIDCSQLQASAINGHPGPRVTEFIAEEVLKYINDTRKIPDTFRR
ncbi:MAG: hypothetical protein SFW35_07100 [Chitinophagales bacterium]|nr:hypothetical protein [Chitinophagales bacterium]